MAPLTEPAFARLRSVDPVLAEAAGDAAFELETDLFAALAKGIMEKGHPMRSRSRGHRWPHRLGRFPRARA